MFLHMNRYISLYFLLILLIAPIHLLGLDSYYYWDWSRHLALSYYDGSPMIAYFIHIATLLFGDTLFALNLVTIVSTALTSFIIYKTARLCLNKEASYVTVLIWLFSPLVTLDLINQTTYDTPLTLFWALTLYFTIRYIQFNRNQDLYYIGLSIGLMLLSKYSGIVLVLALLVFLVATPYRRLFKSRHFYLALTLAIIVFSPVILWNAQHDWVSIRYQLSTHQSQNTHHAMGGILHAFFNFFLPAINFLFIPPALYLSKGTPRKSPVFYLCLIISVTFVLFYLFVAGKAMIRGYWLSQYIITASLLAGYCYQEWAYRNSTYLLIVFYVLTSGIILMNNTTLFSFGYSKKLAYYQSIQQINQSNDKLPSIAITPGWFEARMLFFLKNKPTIFTFDCGSMQNQYRYWSPNLNTLGEVLYIDTFDRLSCVKKYFAQCQSLNLPAAFDEKGKPIIYAYWCSNKLDI
ncbi:TPA: dolichol monophosphate mannose synthase [Legionella pneumophila subsp. pneumophila]|uniref:Glycosyltransferase RgtA/B/C/D-like domain-containing protein n=1 Tax=Legionella pneumophila (strain Lens) TaxID=297245 RepID=Q5WWU1_LEGPL|nr:glycosyltransferase family 39 protein [Legionella pneumophila]AOW52048.1 dolichol monophosphate mannose synthase [Legionella pneumophila subsp. pneumophila]AOW54360.1 dolichol monophosphate mannose synthase [Legionella pneumophila subsp. pneumophila]AOW57345.1 dolichol monophosphate mannose synthase [Legionella pneumophila subsp. pneumophila]AOW59730.1 dolichol monophosphate mannose synthase [Legionella pneumophila subsp. pneumophila]AOW62843.1 dolichol monophosphate mannose synthase [Legio